MKLILMKMVITVSKILQGLLISFNTLLFKLFLSSTIRRVHRSSRLRSDNDDDNNNDDMTSRHFTLKDGDELSDVERLDDSEHITISNRHIHDNFKVDNERGMKIVLF